MIGHGADRHDVAGAALDEMRHDGARDEEGPREVHRDRSSELGRRYLLDPLDEEEAGVVHDDVRDAALGEDAADRPVNGCGIRHVAPQVGAGFGGAVGEAAGEPHHVGPGRFQGAGHGEPDPARRTGDEGEPTGERRGAHSRPRPPYTSLRNSSRVFASWSSAPRSALVTVLEFCFSTPRIIMQRW